MLQLLVLSSVLALCFANHAVHMYNRCGKEIWVGVLGNTLIEGGGFKMYNGQSHTVYMPDHWSGRVWARTGCGGSSCQTGDCGGGRLKCNGAGGIPPVTLAEITFDGAGNQDFYDISLVDGYNVKMTMKPTNGQHDYANHGHYYCGQAGCNDDLNRHCPSGMQVYGTGGVVACKSACLAFNRDEYCCRNAHGTPATCPNFGYAQTFKNDCPEAYSYAYDDRKSTFTCRGNNGGRSAYDIIFC